MARDAGKRMRDQQQPDRLTIQGYQQHALRADQLGNVALSVALLGLFGETGSLLSEAKKKHRDAISYTGYEATVIEELGDVLWYLTAVAHRGGSFTSPVRDAMVTRLETIEPDATIADLLPIFARDRVAVVEEDGRFYGLITRVDLLNHLRQRVA